MDVKESSLPLADCEGNHSREQLEQCLDTITLQDLDVKERGIADGNWGAIDIVQMKNDKWKDCAFVLKRMIKSKITTASDQQHILAEKQIMSSLNCDFIVRYYRTFQDSRNLYILMEFCQGGDLWWQCPVNRDAAIFYTACVVEALSYLHERNIIHRDIKAENIVLDSKGYAKLIDFGLARRLEKNTRAFTVCGTLQAFAPEILRLCIDVDSPGYDTTVDLWALGQTLYMMLTGHNAFSSDVQEETVIGILNGMNENVFLKENIADDVKDIILQLCEIDPTSRLGCKERGGFDVLRQHRCFLEIDWSLLRDRRFPPPMIPDLASPTDIRYFDPSLCDNVSENTPLVDNADWAKYF